MIAPVRLHQGSVDVLGEDGGALRAYRLDQAVRGQVHGVPEGKF